MDLETKKASCKLIMEVLSPKDTKYKRYELHSIITDVFTKADRRMFDPRDFH